MTLTLVGDIGVSTILTVVGDGMGVRMTMAVGSLLMMGSGVAFAVLEDYWYLLAASILGVINPRYASTVAPFMVFRISNFWLKKFRYVSSNLGPPAQTKSILSKPSKNQP